MSNGVRVFTVFVLVSAVAALAATVPFALIWAVATLAGREPEYTRWTWLAALTVMTLLAGPRPRKA